MVKTLKQKLIYFSWFVYCERVTKTIWLEGQLWPMRPKCNKFHGVHGVDKWLVILKNLLINVCNQECKPWFGTMLWAPNLYQSIQLQPKTYILLFSLHR